MPSLEAALPLIQATVARTVEAADVLRIRVAKGFERTVRPTERWKAFCTPMSPGPPLDPRTPTERRPSTGGRRRTLELSGFTMAVDEEHMPELYLPPLIKALATATDRFPEPFLDLEPVRSAVQRALSVLRDGFVKTLQ